MAFERIATRISGNVGIVQLNRAASGNSLAPEEAEIEIQLALEGFRVQRDVHAVVLTGSGDVFSIGNVPRSDPAVHGGRSLGERLAVGYSRGIFWYWLAEFPKPIVAAVNGFTADGGWELALMCDLIVAAESARFSMNQLEMGVSPAHAICAYLVSTLGKHRAMDLVLGARTLTAAQCLDLGLVTGLAPDGGCEAAAVRLAQSLARRPPVAVTEIRKLIRRDAELVSAHDLERTTSFFLRTTADMRAAAEAWQRSATGLQPGPTHGGVNK